MVADKSEGNNQRAATRVVVTDKHYGCQTAVEFSTCVLAVIDSEAGAVLTHGGTHSQQHDGQHRIAVDCSAGNRIRQQQH